MTQVITLLWYFDLNPSNFFTFSSSVLKQSPLREGPKKPLYHLRYRPRPFPVLLGHPHLSFPHELSTTPLQSSSVFGRLPPRLTGPTPVKPGVLLLSLFNIE